MRRRLALVAPLVALLLTAPSAHANDNPPPPPPVVQPQTGVSALIAVPASGHPGDIIYLSGTGLRPHRRYYVLMACPSALSGDALQNGNVKFIPPLDGPETDAKGNFVRFEFRALMLRRVASSGCTIYTSDGNTPYGPDIPATYYIFPRGRRLPRCSRTICAGVTLAPRRARSGQSVTIRIGPSAKKGYTSWPGARATVTVNFRGVSAVRRTVTLNWAGAGETTVRVPGGLSVPSEAQVQVGLRIGKYSGVLSDQLSVVH